MTDLHTLVLQDRRLALLTLLANSSGYKAGGPMLQLALAGIGHNVALDTVGGDMAWLRDSGLLSLDNVGGIYIALLTPRGLDVAKGYTEVPGVARPRPE